MYYTIEGLFDGRWIHRTANGFTPYEPALPYETRDFPQALVDTWNERENREFRIVEHDWMSDPAVVAFSNELHEYNGSDWRISAPTDDLLYIEVDGFPFYLKVKPFDPKTHHITIQRTQVKCQYDAGWIVAFIRSGFYDSNGKPLSQPNHYIVNHLNEMLNVRPTTPKHDPRINVYAWR